MDSIYVTFSPDEKTIIAVFSVQQEPPVTEIQSDDSRWAAFYGALTAASKAGWPAPSQD